MTEEQTPQPGKQSSRDDALAVVRRLRDAAHVAYFAGGCVRDQLLGLEPKDYDVATDAPPDRVRQLFSNTQAVGAAFGVILVRHRTSQIEVATFRTDGKYVDGRRPEGVTFATAEEDAKRRDFTINGMFYDPIEDKVIDYVGGQADLNNKVLRAIGEPNHRFEEDHLRLLRAVRFAARFGFRLDDQTAAAIKCHAGELARISPERVGEELRLMLTPPTRENAYLLLRWHGLLDVLMRFLPEKCTGNEDELSFLPFDTMRPEVRRGPISFGFALAATTLDFRMNASGNYDPLVFTTEKEIRVSCQAMRRALKISNDEYDRMAGALSFGHLLGDAEPTVATLKRFLATPTSSDARALMETCHMPGPLGTRIEQNMKRLAELERKDVAPPPLVTGDDLIATGLKPGPLFKRVLDAVYDAQLEDRVRTKAEAMVLAMEIARG